MVRKFLFGNDEIPRNTHIGLSTPSFSVNCKTTSLFTGKGRGTAKCPLERDFFGWTVAKRAALNGG